LYDGVLKSFIDGAVMKKRIWKFTEKKFSSSNPSLLFGVFLLYLLLSWSAWYLVDIRNWLGLRELIIFKEILGPMAGEQVPLWWFIFKEAGPTEIFQWGALLSTCLGSLILSRHLRELGLVKPGLFWRLMSLVALLMFLEDAGNFRHLISYLVVWLAGMDWESTAGMYLRNMLELSYFGILAAVPVYGLLRYFIVIVKALQSFGYLITGYFFYGIAVLASGTRFFDEWYAAAGTLLHEFMKNHARGEFLQVGTEVLPMEFWLMDFMVEESLELIGAGALLAATAAYWRYMQREKVKMNEASTC